MQKTAEITEDSMLMASNAAHFFFFCSVHKYSHITECHSLLLLLYTHPSSLSYSPSADLCGEERGDWRFPPAEQRKEERLGPCEVSTRNMMAGYFS